MDMSLQSVTDAHSGDTDQPGSLIGLTGHFRPRQIDCSGFFRVHNPVTRTKKHGDADTDYVFPVIHVGGRNVTVRTTLGTVGNSIENLHVLDTFGQLHCPGGSAPAIKTLTKESGLATRAFAYEVSCTREHVYACVFIIISIKT